MAFFFFLLSFTRFLFYFIEQIHSCDINLEPEYQRGTITTFCCFFYYFSYLFLIDVVWPEAKQIGIIDSVFRNFYIPPMIFAVNMFEDGSETKTSSANLGLAIDHYIMVYSAIAP